MTFVLVLIFLASAFIAVACLSMANSAKVMREQFTKIYSTMSLSLDRIDDKVGQFYEDLAPIHQYQMEQIEKEQQKLERMSVLTEEQKIQALQEHENFQTQQAILQTAMDILKAHAFSIPVTEARQKAKDIINEMHAASFSDLPDFGDLPMGEVNSPETSPELQ